MFVLFYKILVTVLSPDLTERNRFYNCIILSQVLMGMSSLMVILMA